MIYTSYFGKYKGNNGVAICMSKPGFYKGEGYYVLGPSKDLLDWWTGLNAEQKSDPFYQNTYRIRYTKETLSKLDVHKVAKDLENKVLLCYEKSDSFCHRHIVAEWLNKNGYICEEYK